MWIVKLLQKAVGYGRAYLLGFSWNGVATRSQYTRLYFVNLAFAGTALFGLFDQVRFFRPLPNAQTQEIATKICTPLFEGVHFVAFFVLAEIASFLFLIISQGGSYATGRPFSSGSVFRDLTTVGHRLEWRHYRLMWLWFPVVLVLLSQLAASDFTVAVSRCIPLAQEGKISLLYHKFNLLKMLVFPYFIVIFIVIVFGYWWMVRWKFSLKMAFLLALSFLSYVVAIAIVGPPDLLRVVEFTNFIPELIQKGFKYILNV